MLHQTERMGELFAEVTVHDSRDAIKHALASAGEELDIDVSYLSAVWPGELSSPSASAAEQMGSVPVRSTHGRVHGALVCRARPGGPQPDDCDLTVVRVLARVIADQLDREEQQVERWREHAESMGLRALLSAVQARDCAATWSPSRAGSPAPWVSARARCRTSSGSRCCTTWARSRCPTVCCTSPRRSTPRSST